MAKAPSAAPPPVDIPLDQLQAAVMDLAEDVGQLTDLMEHLRADLSRFMNKGIPSAAAGGDQSAAVAARIPITATMLEEACDWFADNQAQLLQEQLNLIVSAQDEMKWQILAAIAGDPPGKSRKRTQKSQPAADQSFAAPRPSDPSRAAGPVPDIEVASTANMNVAPSALPSVTLWELGAAVELTFDAREVWGEIVALDDASNTATVLLIPSEEEIIVSQDSLQPERASVGTENKLGPLVCDSLADRQHAFKTWVETVRDPAERHSEGLRQLSVVGGAAYAAYAIAHLPDSTFAIHTEMRFAVGDQRGRSSSWQAYPTREACLDSFLSVAREFFGEPQPGSMLSDRQRQAQADMQRRLAPGLFGFVEPPVEPE